MDNKLRQLRLAQLYIAEEIKRVCDNNNISYFLDCGSMLGAVRHRGFIPWDDDMDIGMLKHEYDRFISIAPKELHSDFFLDDYSTNPKCANVFSKVRLKGTKYIESKGNQHGDHNEIFVDIFPYFSIANGKKWKSLSYKLAFWGWALSSKAGCKIWKGDGIKKRIGFLPAEIVGSICSYDYLRKKIACITDVRRNTDTVCILDGSLRSYKHWHIPRTYLEEFIISEFEGHKFPIPKEFDRYLTIGYGDYMTIPPVEQQVTHMITELDLGSYIFTDTL